MPQPKDFGFGEEEQMVRDSARRFLRENLPIDRLRGLVAKDHVEAYQSEVPPAAYDENLWKRIIELGWTALAVPEADGGVGMKMVALASLAEEAGRAALPSPLISTLIATCVVRECDNAGGVLASIAGGRAATLAVTTADGSWEADDTDVAAHATASGAILNGSASFVQDARKAGVFIVSARNGSGIGLYAVAADAPGVKIVPDRIVDLTRDQATVEFADVEVTPPAIIAAPGSGEQAMSRALPAMLTIVAADICGAAEWQLQTTTEYAKVRKQFDRAIGFFQAVKHPIVDMMVDIDRARSIVYTAACAIDSEPDDALKLARMAKAAASDAAAFCSGRSVQLHGGIGFTWECDLHIYFKRQKHNQMYLGDGAYQRAKLAELYV
jgi:alkylation response protein AidB-like acyl-CoA dehydrogenase